MLKLLILLVFTLPAFSQSESQTAARLFEQQKYDQARVVYLKIALREPRNPDAIEHLGDLEAMGRKWSSAADYYRRLVAIRPNDAQAQYKFGGALSMIAGTSNTFKALSLVGEIRSAFENAIRLDPNHINARWALVEFYLQLPGIFGGSEAKATKYANQLARLSPVDHYLAKARIDEYFERFSSAEKNYKKADEIGQSETTRKKLAAIRTKIKNAES